MANTERTFIAIKPDGVQRGLVGDIIKRFEQKGFRLVAMKFLRVRAPPPVPPRPGARRPGLCAPAPRLSRPEAPLLPPPRGDPRPPSLSRGREHGRPWEGYGG